MELTQYRAEVLKLSHAYESPGTLLQCSFLGPDHSDTSGPQVTL